MNVNLTDQTVSNLLSGLITVLVLIVIGKVLSSALRKMDKKFPFTRMALVLALTPLTLIRFFNYGDSSTLFLFAMICTLLGITIDGISHLLEPKEVPGAMPAEATKEEAKEEAKEQVPSRPGMIVWEKAQ